VFGHIRYSVLSIGFCLLIGKSIEIFIPILPASLYGMATFTLLLHYRFLNALRIKLCIEWALDNMAVCFVPAGVGIINHFELIKQHGVALVAIILFTTFLLLTLVGLSYQRQLNKHEVTVINEPTNDK
jgi:holin-like protein